MSGINTITAANSVFLLSVVGLFDSPQQLQGFAADAAFSGDSRTPAETVMGVDGKMSVGFTFSLYKQKISIMPDSDSYALFEEWLSAMEAAQEIYVANATIVLPSIGRSYDLTRGALTSAKPIPDVKKVLQASEFEITWERVVGGPL
jgi:hypothetical protein